MQLSHLCDGRRAIERWLGAHDPDVDVAERDLGSRRPCGGPGGAFALARVCSGGAVPALARQLSQRTRGLVVDQRADVVEWTVAAAVGVAPCRIGWQVGRRVPAVTREVEAADERQRIVDDDQLLMVRSGGRMMII